MFRFASIAIALVALGALLSGGLEGGSLLFLAPLFFLGKVLFLLVLFGAVGGFFWRSHGGGPRRPSWDRHGQSRGRAEPEKSSEELFEEWHRVAHAREEVDTWVEDLD